MLVVRLVGRKIYLAQILLYLFATIILLIQLFPVIWLISSSLKVGAKFWEVPFNPIPNPISLDNYVQAFSAATEEQMMGGHMGKAFVNSTIVTIIVVASQLWFCSLAGYSLARFSFPGKEIVFYLILATIMIPPALLYIPLYEVVAKLKWFDTYQALVMPNLMAASTIFFMRQFLITVPQDLIDQARIDGSPELNTFVSIILPLAKPALATLGIFAFVAAWNDFFWPLIVAADWSHATVQVALAKFAVINQWVDMTKHTAAGVIAALPVMIAFIVFQRWITQGIALTGLKY